MKAFLLKYLVQISFLVGIFLMIVGVEIGYLLDPRLREIMSAPAAPLAAVTDTPPPYPEPIPVDVTPTPQPVPTQEPTPTAPAEQGATVRWAVVPPLVPGSSEILLVCYEEPCSRVAIYCGSGLLCRLEGEGGGE
jgi:hypothetical protein